MKPVQAVLRQCAILVSGGLCLAVLALPWPAQAGGVHVSVGLALPVPVAVLPAPVVVAPAPVIVHQPPVVVHRPPVIVTEPYVVHRHHLPPGLAKKLHRHHHRHGHSFVKHGRRHHRNDD